MKITTIMRLAGILLALSASTNLQAQGDFTLEIDRQSIVTTPSGFVEFNITITNTSLSPFTMQVTRTTNQLPNSSWYSSMCSGDQCYSPETDNMPVPLKVGEVNHARLTVLAGTVPNESGRFALQFDAGMGGNPVTKEFTVTVGSASSVDPVSPAIAANQILPNPAVSSARYTYQLPSAGDSRIEIYSMMGLRVLALENGFQVAGSHDTNLDLSSLASGAYVLRLIGDGILDTKQITVAR